jgi:hypothetical protein
MKNSELIEEKAINMDEFMNVKERLGEAACSVYQNSQTGVMLDRLR